MIISEKVAYLKGLTEGLKISASTDEGKVLTEIINTLELIAFELEDQNQQIEELDAYVDEIDEDLSVVEDVLFDDEDYYDDDEEDDDYEDDEDECCCCNSIESDSEDDKNE